MDGNAEYWLRWNDVELKYNLRAENYVTMQTGPMTTAVDSITYPVWDRTNSLNDFAAVFTLHNAAPVARSWIARAWADGAPPFAMHPVAVVDNGVETAQDPCPFVILNGMGGATRIIAFASKDRDDSSYNLYFYSTDIPTADNVIDILLDPLIDFEQPAVSPDATTLAFTSDSTLYAMDLFTGDFSSAINLADRAAGDVVWYDPTP